MRQYLKVKARMGKVFNETPTVFPFCPLSNDPDQPSVMGMGRQREIASLSDPHFANWELILLGMTGNTFWDWS